MTAKPQADCTLEKLAYTPKELASALGLSRKAVYRAIGSGELRAAKVCGGSRLLVPVDAASEWIERNLVVPKTAARRELISPGRPPDGHAPLREALTVLRKEDDEG